MPFQTKLPEFIRAQGLKVETVPGWETRGRSSFNPGGAVCHWTAGPRGTNGRPSLAIVTYGRPDLPGPLCNVYLDRNGVAVVVAAGRANHAGPGGWKGLSGNSSVFGTEAESAGNGDWTEAQRIAYPKLNAAYAKLAGFDAGKICGHNEWAPSRKIDIRDWPMSKMRESVGKILANAAPAKPAPVISEIKEDEQLLRVRNVVSGEVYLVGPNQFQHLTVTQNNILEKLKVPLTNLSPTEVQVVQGLVWSSDVARRTDVGTARNQLREELDLVQGDVAKLANKPDTDPAVLASALAEAIPDELAQRVVDELTNRLAN